MRQVRHHPPVRVGMPPIILFFAAATLAAKPELAAVFGDHMVLQRGMPAPVWGTADPGAAVSVRFAGQERATTAATDGTWRVDLAPLTCPPDHAAGEMVVRSGTETISISDVLIGDVWLCGGQSNMAFKLARATGGKQAAASAADPLLRLCDVAGKRSGPGDPPPRDLARADWKVAAADFSAVAWYFGIDLRASAGVPVGLIDTSVGGTSMKSWMSREAMTADPVLREEVARVDREFARYPEMLARYKRLLAAYQQRSTIGTGPRHKPIKPKGPDSSFRLSYLYESVIRPLQPFAIKGVIWYQGEADAGRHAMFHRQFSALVGEWRQAWGQGDFPWLHVQLAPYSTGPTGKYFPHVWEAQAKSLDIPNSAMVVALDRGRHDDIHPPDKAPIGRRLALAARALAYGQDVKWRGPFFNSFKIHGEELILHFDTAGSELTSRSPAPEHFIIAGADRKFIPANARLATDGKSVVVSHPEIPEPVAARYGWYSPGGPVGASIFDNDGLPAAPFRTDDWAD